MYITKVLKEKQEFIPFTYLIGWSKLNKFYYGVRYSKTANPSTLWTNYFTSSTYVKEYRKLYGEPDIIEVRKTFSDANDALQYERRVLSRLLSPNNINRNKWINVAIGQDMFSINDDVIKKISISRIRYIKNRTKEQIEIDNKARIRASLNKEGRKKISEKAKERFKNPLYRKHYEDNVWGNEEYLKNLSKRTKNWLSDSNTKKEWLKTVQSDEYRRLQSTISKETQNREDVKIKKSKAMKETLSKDSKRKEMSEKAKSATGNRIASRELNKIENIELYTSNEVLEIIKSKVKYEFDVEKILKKIKDKLDNER